MRARPAIGRTETVNRLIETMAAQEFRDDSHLGQVFSKPDLSHLRDLCQIVDMPALPLVLPQMAPASCPDTTRPFRTACIEIPALPERPCPESADADFTTLVQMHDKEINTGNGRKCG